MSSKDNVTTGKPVENTNKVESGSGSSSTKPSGSTGTANTGTTSKPSGGNTKPSSNSGTSKPSGSNSSSSSSGSSSNTGSSSSSSTKGDEHKHNYNIPITKTVHHNAETKTVHHDAVTKVVTVVDKAAWDEPIYEGGYYICNKCGYHSKDGEDVLNHCSDVCDSGYHTGKVQVGTKHHGAETHQETQIVSPARDETVVVKQAYDETVTTGYKCSCGKTK